MPPASKTAGCFHAAVEEPVEAVILDVWSRQYQKLEGGKAAPKQAQVFCAFLHVPASAVGPLQRTTYPGVYFEPRSETGGVDPAFAVVWLPNQDHAAVRHVFQTCEKAVAVTRLGKKYLRGSSPQSSCYKSECDHPLGVASLASWMPAYQRHSTVEKVEFG